LTIGSVQPAIVLDKLLDPSAKYQPEKYSWIGRIQPIILIGIGWRASGVQSIEDCKEKPVIVSASGVSGTSAIVPWALNKLAGTKFRVIRGYEAQFPQFVAMERGEVQGVGSASLTDALANSDWTKNHKVTFLYNISLHRSPLIPNVPSIVELAKTNTDKKVMAMIASVSDIGQTLMAPPNIPPERLSVLRKAFLDMAHDPSFIEQAKKLGIFVDPMRGESLSDLVISSSVAPAELVTKLREVTRPQS
jgi:tripartite-type tricarboxylate transporter receptor subunit TctC